jgi:hypothetical protein
MTGFTGAIHGTPKASLVAGADIAGDYLAVKRTADISGNVVETAVAATDEVVGITQGQSGRGNDSVGYLTGDHVFVITDGFARATAGGAIAVDDKLTVNASGKLIATTTAGHRVCAIATSTGVADDIVEVKVITPVLYSAFA